MDAPTREEMMEQAERSKKARKIRIAKEAPIVQQLVKKLQTPLEFNDIILISNGLFYEQITFEMLSKEVFEEYCKTRQGKASLRKLKK